MLLGVENSSCRALKSEKPLRAIDTYGKLAAREENMQGGIIVCRDVNASVRPARYRMRAIEPARWPGKRALRRAPRDRHFLRPAGVIAEPLVCKQVRRETKDAMKIHVGDQYASFRIQAEPERSAESVEADKPSLFADTYSRRKGDHGVGLDAENAVDELHRPKVFRNSYSPRLLPASRSQNGLSLP